MVYLVVTSAEDELGVWVEVENTLDNFTLVDSDRANFKVLLADENCAYFSQLMYR